MWDQPGVHDIYRRWRKVTDSYSVEGEDADRILCAEAWVLPAESLARYVRAVTSCTSRSTSPFLMTPWIAAEMRAEITRVARGRGGALGAADLGPLEPRRGPPRLAARLRAGARPAADAGDRRRRPATRRRGGAPPGAGRHDGDAGLPGSAYLYQGEELGLPEATRLPDEVRQDPAWERSGHTYRGRDGCRVPMPWEGDAPSYGFGPTSATWLPQPEEYGELAVDRQTGVPGSTLELYRTLLRLRREHRIGRGELSWVDLGEDVLAFDMSPEAGTVVRVIANVGGDPVALPEAEVLVASADVDLSGGLPSDTAVWLLRG